MSDLAIRAEGLGKRYRIGLKEQPHDTLFGALAAWLKAPLKNYRALQKLSRFGEHEEADDIIWALRDLSLEVEQGEVVGVIGRNGAGKSTLLKILSRITEPTTGWADIHGRVSSLLEVGTGFHSELTGRENAYLNGTVLGMSKKEVDRKFDEIVDFAEIEKFIDTPIKRYSSGMKVRLAFAVAAHLEPEILLIDEVLAVGDTAFQKKCLGRMGRVAREGRTVLFVSHDMSAITRLCPRAILLEHGTLVGDGRTPDIVAQYLSGVAAGGATRLWDRADAPGSEEVKLLSVTLSKADGAPVAIASVEDELSLTLGYYVGKPNQKFRCIAVFYTQGVCAFASMEPAEVRRDQIDIYYSTVVIPPHLLAEGEYTIHVALFSSLGGKQHYFVDVREAIAFQVTDPMNGGSARGDYGAHYGGVMRPLLPWKTYSEAEMPQRS